MAAATTATPDTADAVAAKAVASVIGKKAPAASSTGLTLTVDAADKTALSRTQATALSRARAVLVPAFTVDVSYEPSTETETPAEDEGEPTETPAA